MNNESNNGVSFVLGFLFPGLGHLYKGKLGEGLVWFLVISVGYFFLIIPGIVLHLISLFTLVGHKPNK